MFIPSGFQSLIPYNRTHLVFCSSNLSGQGQEVAIELHIGHDLCQVLVVLNILVKLQEHAMAAEHVSHLLLDNSARQTKFIVLIPAANMQHFRTKKKINHLKNKHRTNTGLKKLLPSLKICIKNTLNMTEKKTDIRNKMMNLLEWVERRLNNHLNTLFFNLVRNCEILHVFAGCKDVFYQLNIIEHQGQPQGFWVAVELPEDVQGASQQR